MNSSIKYVGMDVHKEMTVIVVLDAAGIQLSRLIVQNKFYSDSFSYSRY